MTRLPLRRRLVAAALEWENRSVLDGLQAPPEPLSTPIRILIVVALLGAVLASCAPGAPRSPGSPLPPAAPASAAPLHPWCEVCRDLPSLGTSPRVSRRGP